MGKTVYTEQTGINLCGEIAPRNESTHRGALIDSKVL